MAFLDFGIRYPDGHARDAVYESRSLYRERYEGQRERFEPPDDETVRAELARRAATAAVRQGGVLTERTTR